MQKEFYPLSKVNANPNFMALFLPTVTSFRYYECVTTQKTHNARNENYADEIQTTTGMTLQEFSNWNLTPTSKSCRNDRSHIVSSYHHRIGGEACFLLNPFRIDQLSGNYNEL